MNPATTSSAGTYVLTATNSGGSASSNAIVVTVVEPILVSNLPTQTVAGGATVTLAPAISGPGTLTYQWFGPNGNIIGATGPTLTLTNVDASNLGNYTITVTNVYQSVQGNAYVVVNAAPYINIQPTSQTSTSGFSFLIYAGIQGAGPLTYQWSKDGVLLQDVPSRISGSATPTLSVSNSVAGDAGVYTLTVTNSYGSTNSNGATITIQANPYAPTITTQPAGVAAFAGSLVTFSVVATDPLTYDTMTYQWYKGSTPITGATGSSFVIPAVSASDAGSYSVAVSNSSSSTVSTGAILTVGAAATLPVVTVQPTSQTVNVGASITLTTAATGNPTPTLQWQKNGTAIAGATSVNLLLSNLQLTDAGAYSVIATNIAGSAASSSATVTVTALPTARVINLSTRAQVGTGDNILIAGFIINGSTPKKMLVRAIGPALTNYGISNFLADPSLKIVDNNGNTVATNDDWGVTSDLADFNATSTKVGAVPLPAGSKDSALVATLAPGGYTALVTGNNNTTGVALVELYEVDTTTPNQLINISSRAQVGTGASVTIAGVIVSGSSPQKFLVRAIGPGLQARGVSAFLPDPQFDIVDSSSNKTIATNDDWETSATVGDVKAVTASMGVSPLSAGSKDSALTITLAPGGYTVVVRGSNSSSGIALVELYQVP